MKVVFSTAAKRDVVRIARYIALESPMQSRAVVAQIHRRIYELEQFPRSCPTIAGVADTALRKLTVGSFNVLYAVRGDRVEVSRVLHGARDIARILADMKD
ncbi:type II toxin-antitoxin system RelE/ParE family toxin [Aureimonas psammosilenae]|jgi:toxin ParE1/3/4|uniref:type II toxin-antitoxin system RelE/ParE family toxin n=1 Tax=Aureimonas psammosilenae TaxID=2495496 RepID=UPI0012604D00|nr:type II toxin-antitoxin system RelE/ParE family toxin [Aureimonas psammosilenae]